MPSSCKSRKEPLIPIVREAARIAGSVSELARRMGVTPQAFYLWSRVPAERVPAFVKATGGRIPAYRVRPDLYMVRTTPLRAPRA